VTSDKLALSLTATAVHSSAMDRKRSDSSWRTTAFAAALFAITLNFLQPLAHTALMRDGAPTALWTVFCNSAAADPDGKQSGSMPHAGQAHECCLGLAHATTSVAPPNTFIIVEPVVVAAIPSLPAEQPQPVGIRDGPSQPRGPPSVV
jgi:hypothetical protein